MVVTSNEMQGGKRARLRDMGLWADPPEYYGGPEGFVTVDLDAVKVRCRTVPYRTVLYRSHGTCCQLTARPPPQSEPPPPFPLAFCPACSLAGGCCMYFAAGAAPLPSE